MRRSERKYQIRGFPSSPQLWGGCCLPRRRANTLLQPSFLLKQHSLYQISIAIMHMKNFHRARKGRRRKILLWDYGLADFQRWSEQANAAVRVSTRRQQGMAICEKYIRLGFFSRKWLSDRVHSFFNTQLRPEACLS